MHKYFPFPYLTGLILVFISSVKVMGQEGNDQQYVHNTFMETRVVNGHSVVTQPLGELKFIISHRFGPIVDSGFYNLFGIDDALIRLGLDYGITDQLTVGFGRSNHEKSYNGYVKYRLLHQHNNMPLSLTYLGNSTVTTLTAPFGGSYEPELTERIAYTHQMLLARKFGDRLSLQMMPTLVHKNFIANDASKNDIYSIGVAGRYQIRKFVGVNLEYFYNLPGQVSDQYHNAFSIGVDLETSGHIFQLHLTNSRGLSERYFITETADNFFDLNRIHFGFNITREFQIRGKDY